MNNTYMNKNICLLWQNNAYLIVLIYFLLFMHNVRCSYFLNIK